MSRILMVLFLCCTFSFLGAQSESTVKIGLLKYKGGGDWYANPTALPNLVDYCNKNLGLNINQSIGELEPTSSDIFNYAFLHMTGHGNVVFNKADAEQLRTYLLAGGFLHIDDNYGMDPFVRPALKSIFPEAELVELPFNHEIYNKVYNFDRGLPKIHEHDGHPPQGFGLFYEGRMICFYSYECDLGDGWEDQAVHNDPQEVREKALQMGANILSYAFTQ